MPSRGLFLVVSLTVAILVHAQSPARHPAQAGPRHTAVSSGTASDQYKGIFEPVNYGQDINFTDVFFVSPDVGWVTGEHATILKTTDGGKTWKAQVGGDPDGNEPAIGQLRFLDARRGWALTGDDRLLRTMDGENWDQIGQGLVPGSGFIDYAFTSLRHGIALGGNMGGFFVTNDGGRHWQHVSPCQISVRIQGLPQSQTCYPLKLQMLSASSGLAITTWRSPEAPNATSLAIFRTDNGGQSWTYVVPPFHDCCGPDLFFIDLQYGVLVFNSGKTYLTADGGKSWRALIAGGVGLTTGGSAPPLRFADPEVGWSVGASPDNSDTFRVSYSTDSGQHWKMSHNIAFPVPRSSGLKFSFPRRDRAYVVGPHGMIYRYRIVPANYAAANAFDGPLMPGFSDAPLNAGMQRIRRDIVALQTKLNPALVAAGLPPVTATLSSPPASNDTAGSPSFGNNSVDSQATDASSSTSAGVMSSGSSDMPSGAPVSGTSPAGVTPQSSGDTSTTTGADSPGSSAVTADAGAAFSPASSGDNAQVASPEVQNCCASEIKQLQSDVSGFQQQVPAFTSKYRTLNLIVAGLRIAQDMIGKAEAFKTTLIAFKKAPNLQSAASVLQDFIAKYDGARQEFASGFSNPPPVPDSDASTSASAAAATSSPSSAASDSANAPPAVTAADTAQAPVAAAAAAAGAQSQNGQTQGSQVSSNGPVTQSADQAVQKTEDKVKKKLKDKLKWPQL